MKRRPVAWLACLLVVGQMVLGPLAQPAPDEMTGVHCSHATASGGPSSIDSCDGCPSGHRQAPRGSHHGHDGASTHARCACQGAHTPALTAASPVVSRPDGTLALSNEPVGRTFSAPLFEVLRPPN